MLILFVVMLNVVKLLVFILEALASTELTCSELPFKLFFFYNLFLVQCKNADAVTQPQRINIHRFILSQMYFFFSKWVRLLLSKVLSFCPILCSIFIR
jgi:hypothetical protein